MKKYLKVFFTVIIIISFLLAGGSQPVDNALAKADYSKVLLIDNFDDANITAGPEWWTFDNLKLNFREAKDDKYGLYYLEITGTVDNYYLGGMGTYIGKDASDYDTLAISIFGTGPKSGTLRLQLYDDDNKTYQLEQDSTYQVLYDDYLEYEVQVNWEGWRTVEIPISKFVDMNQGVGDDVWNPDQKEGSGGLLHFQFVVVSPEEKGTISLAIDSIKLVKKTN